MGGAKKLTGYLNKKDKFGVAVGTWAVPLEPGVAKCKWCESPVKYFKGLTPLTNHSESTKHLLNVPKDTTRLQLTLEEALDGGEALRNAELAKIKKSRKFQLELVRSLSRHRVPFEFIDCLVPILKKHIKDDVVQDLNLHHSKGAYLVKNAVCKSYRNETVKLLHESDAFVIGFDETEINKVSQLEVLVKLSHPKHGIQLRHYRTIALESGDAQTIAESILEVFKEDCIDFEHKLVGAMSDGCNVMEGQYKGVKKRFHDAVPGFVDMGSCSSHHIGNSFKYAVINFDNDSHEALVHIFFDIGGAKGRGLKRRKEFEKVAETKGITPAQIKKVCTTRFRSYRISIKPVLSNWGAIVPYYRGVTKPTDRQVKLKEFFVSQEFMTKLKLNFIWAASKELMDCLDFFELREEKIDQIHENMEDLLANSLKKHQQGQVVENIDEDGNLKRKHVRELLEADISREDTKLSVKEVFIGSECTNLIKKLGLTPSSPQLKWFYDKVYMYYVTISQYLQKYFWKGLLSTNLRYMKALSPKNRSNYATSHMLKYQAKSFGKVVENIQSIDGADEIQREIDKYVSDYSLDVYTGLSFADYWEAVGKVKEGEWFKYDLLPRFALSMGTFFNSNSETERAFSVETDVHRDPKKNRMSQDMLDAHMQIRYGVESELSYDKEKCKECSSSRKRAHCHCSSAVINEEMLKLFDGAYKEETSKERDEAVISSEKKSEVEQSESLRINKLKEKLISRKTFYTDKHMEVVYKKEEKISKVQPTTSSSSKTKVQPAKVQPTTTSSSSKTKVQPAKVQPTTTSSSSKLQPGNQEKNKKRNMVELDSGEGSGGKKQKVDEGEK